MIDSVYYGLVGATPSRILKSCRWRCAGLITWMIRPLLRRKLYRPGGSGCFDLEIDRIQQHAIIGLVNLWHKDLLDPNSNPQSNNASSFTECLSRAILGFPILVKHTPFSHPLRTMGERYGMSPMAALYRLEHPILERVFSTSSLRSLYRRIWQRMSPPSCLGADMILLRSRSRGVTCHGTAHERFSDRPFGVNLIGHAFNVFGMGEEIRMAARALQSANVPFCVIDRPADNGSQTTDRSLEAFCISSHEEGPYAFNLVCMAPDQHALWLCQEGLSQQQNRYTITDWPWETSRWPVPLSCLIPMADEFWAFSNLVGEALLPFSWNGERGEGTPLRVITPCTVIQSPDDYCSSSVKAATRKRFCLPMHAVLHVFSFDLNSLIARKNPMAAIAAFQEAFPIKASSIPAVGLVVKTFPPRQPHPEWDTLKRLAAEDSRIHIIEADLDRSDILSLYGCCDVFISLHRSEGLGRGLTEALQLGLDVVATDYGGNTDFCHGPLAHPVPYRLVPIREGEYPHPEGQVWAEPDVHEAAMILRRLANERSLRPHTQPEIMAEYRQRFSAAAVGAAYRQRLEEIWARRFALDAELERRHAAW